MVVPIPVDREGGIGFFDVERFGVALTYEKIARPDGSTAHKIYLGGFAVITRAGTGPYTDTTNYLLGDHLGSTDTITNVNGALVQKMSFDAWGKRRESNWIAMSDPSLFDSTLTTHGFTGHEEIDPVGLIHMNGRVGACPRA